MSNLVQPHADDPVRELRRVVDRCVSYPLVRWSRPSPPATASAARASAATAPGGADDPVTPAQLVHRTCQHLADLAADAQGRTRRPVPQLRPHGLAAQLTVLTNDALSEAPDRHSEVARLLADLRRAL
ncbi:MAG: hypothetical protein ACK5MT_16315 [Actinomycetales bacterium]